MNQQAFAIKHRASGKFFVGFGPAPQFDALFGAKGQAKQLSHEAAKSQALLLRISDRAVQIKPERV